MVHKWGKWRKCKILWPQQKKLFSMVKWLFILRLVLCLCIIINMYTMMMTNTLMGKCLRKTLAFGRLPFGPGHVHSPRVSTLDFLVIHILKLGAGMTFRFKSSKLDITWQHLTLFLMPFFWISNIRNTKYLAYIFRILAYKRRMKDWSQLRLDCKKAVMLFSWGHYIYIFLFQNKCEDLRKLFMNSIRNYNTRVPNVSMSTL